MKKYYINLTEQERSQIIHSLIDNNQVVRRLIHVTVFAQIGTAVIGVFLVKAVGNLFANGTRELPNI